MSNIALAIVLPEVDAKAFVSQHKVREELVYYCIFFVTNAIVFMLRDSSLFSM